MIKKTLQNKYIKNEYFPEPYRNFRGNIRVKNWFNVKVDLSNYAIKTDWMNAKGIATSKLAAKSELASLKAEVNKIDVNKLKVKIEFSKNCLW